MDLGSRQRWAVCTSETAGFKANSETASCLQISQRSTHQLAPRLPLAADRRRPVRRTAHCPTGTETSFSLTTYLTCASASGSRTVDRPAVRLPCFRHGARLCSRPSSDPQRAASRALATAQEQPRRPGDRPARRAFRVSGGITTESRGGSRAGLSGREWPSALYTGGGRSLRAPACSCPASQGRAGVRANRGNAGAEYASRRVSKSRG